MQEPTLVIIKPDGLQKSLTGNILTRLSESKLTIIGCKIKSVSRELAEAHYCRDRQIFDGGVSYKAGDGDGVSWR
jgi:nucleoside-diphosphate kinase